MCHYIGFWTEISLGDNDLITWPRRNGRQQFRFRDDRSALGAGTLRGKADKPNFSLRLHNDTCRGTGSLGGFYRGEILKAPNKGTGRQRRELLLQENRAICAWRPLSGSRLFDTGETTMFVKIRRAHLRWRSNGHDQCIAEACRQEKT